MDITGVWGVVFSPDFDDDYLCDEGHSDCPSPVLCYNPLRGKDG
jgi:hypothetical protein